MYLPENATSTSPYAAHTLDSAYRMAQRQLWSPYLGILVNSGLVTLLLSEVVKYFRTFRKDKPILKATVVALTIVELTQCCFAFYGGYVIFAKRWGRYPVWSQMLWGNMLPNALVASMTHALYSHRLFQLCKRPGIGWLLSVTIGTLSLLQTVSCLVSVYWYAVATRKGGITPMLIARNFFRMWLVICCLVDLIIALGMALNLRASRTGLSITDQLIRRLMWTLVPGGLITGLATFAALLIEVLAYESDFYFFIIICLSKLYGVTILVCLNLRKGRGEVEMQEMLAVAADAKKKEADDEEKVPDVACREDDKRPKAEEAACKSPAPVCPEANPALATYTHFQSVPRLRRLESRSTFASIATGASTPGALPPQYTSGPSWVTSPSSAHRSPSCSPSAYRSCTASPTNSVGTKPLLLCQGSRSLSTQAEELDAALTSGSSKYEEPESSITSGYAVSPRKDRSPVRLRSIDLGDRGVVKEIVHGRVGDTEDIIWMRGRNLPRGSSPERGRKR
ncbi:hypothetical protein BCV69DRAFT_314468 [Microstroma glucosiphilum]|uniref:DUF6534 domain-containing protein n=1 Tax=Pseudomicrostroma glucosiphilum TaxID=1684307 RepID=A0A316U134_9BASI|nr:hypothetical protein BCV69DRAFT_314468 [Pseudomicrostroma glucosiphilum]PWN18584.1 hypothetical protein BCV69DRAFT_314468 [Pseudomicrostroma glucosiphilum]